MQLGPNVQLLTSISLLLMVPTRLQGWMILPQEGQHLPLDHLGPGSLLVEMTMAKQEAKKLRPLLDAIVISKVELLTTEFVQTTLPTFVSDASVTVLEVVNIAKTDIEAATACAKQDCAAWQPTTEQVATALESAVMQTAWDTVAAETEKMSSRPPQ